MATKYRTTRARTAQNPEPQSSGGAASAAAAAAAAARNGGFSTDPPKSTSSGNAGSSGGTVTARSKGPSSRSGGTSGATQAAVNAVNAAKAAAGPRTTPLPAPPTGGGPSAYQAAVNAVNAAKAGRQTVDPAAVAAAMNTGISEMPLQELDRISQNVAAAEEPVPAWTMPEMPEELRELASRVASLDAGLRDYASFTYDPNGDPLYKQYADAYTRNGARAMEDTLGRMAARTGGMASSYAGWAAQQTYDQYMADLAAKIPELQQIAYGMYRDDYNRDVDSYNRAYNWYNNQYNNWYQSALDSYNRYRDTVEDQHWETLNQQNQAQQALENQWRQREWDYDLSRDRVQDSRYNQEWEHQLSQEEREWAHMLEREGVEDQRYAAETSQENKDKALESLLTYAQAGVTNPPSYLLEAAGINLATYMQMYNRARLMMYL